MFLYTFEMAHSRLRNTKKMNSLIFKLLWFNILSIQSVLSFRCDRRPYGAITQGSVGDGRFKLEVVDAETYIPEQLYTVRLFRTDGESVFTEFMISAEGEQRRNEQTRRTITLDPGQMSPMGVDSRHTVNRAGCHNTVEQQNSVPKESVEIYWRAPKSGSGCVTLRAMVAVNDAVWFIDGPPLTKRVCEDLSQPDDIAPVINTECSVCEEAKYEVSFTGIWSRNTHPVLFPENDEITEFSQLVGASHSVEWSPWIAGGMASEGMRELAEYANSSKFEKEIFERIGEGGVRTLIKGRGHRGFGKMSLPAYSYFRADKVRHLVTVAVAIAPSPDWFLGVSRFELCTQDNKWMEERALNLYPWDAGTDNGVSYESANNPTYPQDAIERVKMSSYDRNSPFFEMDMKDLHPFGQLHFRLIRTYARECEESTDENETESPAGEGEGSEEQSEPDEPSRYQNQAAHGGHTEPPIVPDPDAPEDCPMSQWTEWSPCEGICENNRVKGFKHRERYHLIDGKPVEKYDPDDPEAEEIHGEVPKQCQDMEKFELEKCSEHMDCDAEEELKADRRVMGPVKPGQGWNSNKRDLKKKQQLTESTMSPMNALTYL